MNAIVELSTGLEVARFADYLVAAVYRRDVLRSDYRRHQIRGVPA